MDLLDEFDAAAVVPTVTPRPNRKLEIDDSMLKKVEVVLKYILKYRYEIDLYPNRALIKINQPKHVSDSFALEQLTLRLSQACPGVEVEHKQDSFWIILSC